MPKRSSNKKRDSVREIENLRARLKAAEDTLNAIRGGGVDGLIVSEKGGDRLLTFSGTGKAYRVFVEAMAEGAATIAKDGTILYGNGCFAALVDLTPERIAGTSILPLISSEHREIFEGLFAESLKQGSAKAEICLRGVGGAEVPALVSLRSLEEFGAAALCMVVTDLTEQKQNEKLLEAGKLARLIVEQATELVVVCDRHGRIVQASHALHDFYNGNPLLQPFDNVLQLRFGSMNQPFQVKNFSIDEVLAGRTWRGIEVEMTREKQNVPFLLSAGPIRDKDQASVGCVVTLLDIGEHKRLEQSLRESERLAATGRLAATIAHEINNPLEGITNLLYLIETMPDLDPAALKYARTAQQELARVAHITKQTLTFYRESPEQHPLNVKPMIESIVKLYAGKIQHKRLTLHQDLADVHIMGYRNEIMQVISNLFLNAVDAVPDHGEVWVRCYASHEWTNSQVQGIRIVIADRGPGISREDRTRLFEPFFTTKGERGTGLGLWVSHGIVNRHHGFIRFKSRTGAAKSGTLFSVFLPSSADRLALETSEQSELFA